MVSDLVFGEKGERDFRWRGGSVSRLEGLSDAVFALALTLLVVSLKVPASFEELIAVFVEMPVFAACFTLLMVLWFYHYRFHRRFGLEDRPTIVLNAVLLFLVLLYVYPLRFMASFLYNTLILRRAEGAFESFRQLSWYDSRQLMLIYSAGVVLIYAVFAALYARAWSLRAELELDSTERVLTKGELHGHLISLGIGALSFVLAYWRAELVPIAGFIYVLMGPAHGVHGYLVGRAVERYRGKVPGAPMAS
jgi:uncharacterized membrane protein